MRLSRLLPKQQPPSLGLTEIISAPPLEPPYPSGLRFRFSHSVMHCLCTCTCKALGLPLTEVYSCDRKKKAKEFVKQAGIQAQHHVDELSDLVKAFSCGRGVTQACSFHAGESCNLAEIAIDVGVTGFPCAPYSAQRSGRYSLSSGFYG